MKCHFTLLIAVFFFGAPSGRLVSILKQINNSFFGWTTESLWHPWHRRLRFDCHRCHAAPWPDHQWNLMKFQVSTPLWLVSCFFCDSQYVWVLFFGDSVGHNKKHIFKEEFITLLGSRILQPNNHLGKTSGKFISVKAWLWKTGEVYNVSPWISRGWISSNLQDYKKEGDKFISHKYYK